MFLDKDGKFVSPEEVSALVYCGDPARGGQELGMSDAPIRVHEQLEKNGAVVVMEGSLEFGPFRERGSSEYMTDTVHVTHIRYIRHATGEQLGDDEALQHLVIVTPGDILKVTVPFLMKPE